MHSINYVISKSHEKKFITKEHIEMHTHLKSKFELALYSGTLAITLFNNSQKRLR